MVLAAFLALLILSFWEMQVFKKWDSDAFLRCFAVPRTIFLVSLILSCLVFSPVDRDHFAGMAVLMLIMPLYFLRRHAFLDIVDCKRESTTNSAVVSDGIGVAGIWLFSMMVLSKFVSALALVSGKVSEFGELVFTAAVSSVIILGMVMRAARKFSDKGVKHNLSLVRRGKSFFHIYLIPGITGLCFASVSAALLLQRKTHPETPLSEILETVTSPELILLFIFLALVVAPFVEEVTFRGYYYRIAKQVIGARWAFVLITVSFGTLHVNQYWGDWQAIVMVGILGFALTAMRVWTGSTLSSVTMHYVYNIGVTVIPVVFLAVSNPPYFEYQVYYDTLDVPAQERLLLESIHQRAEFADAYNDLARLYVKEGIKLPKALELIKKALTIDPGNEAYLGTKNAILEAIADSKQIR